MPFETGTATDHKDLLAKIKTMITSTAIMGAGNEWVVDRTDTASADHELIVHGLGLTGTEEIYAGIKTYENVGSDYYNFKVAGFTGYVGSNDFDNQPGSSGNMGVPLWNTSIPYWLVANAQRIILFAKVETVFEGFYLGKFLPYATPAQYPYPVIAAGMLATDSETRYSDTGHVFPYSGDVSNFRMRFVDGQWLEPITWPWVNSEIQRPNDVSTGEYNVQAIEMYDTGPNRYGTLDGIFHISGFNQAAENTLTISAVNYVVMRNVWRTGFNDYVALRLN